MDRIPLGFNQCLAFGWAAFQLDSLRAPRVGVVALTLRAEKQGLAQGTLPVRVQLGFRSTSDSQSEAIEVIFWFGFVF